jgi:hypothetical protein
MSLLKNIAQSFKRTKCEHLIRYTGQEITFEGLGIQIPNAKVNLASFSNRIKELSAVPHIVKTLDANQYLLCKQAADAACPDEIRNFCIKIRLVTIMALTQLEALLCIPKPDEHLRKEIVKWVKHMNQLMSTTMDILMTSQLSSERIITPSATDKYALPNFEKQSATINELMKYQGIAEIEMEEAMDILKQPFNHD